MRLLLSGYYGQRNLGDDLLLKVVLDRVTNCRGIQQVDVTCDPVKGAYVAQWAPNARLIDPVKAGAAYRDYDRVLFGGGGTVFDYRASLPLRYLARKRLSVLRSYGIARLSGTRFASIGLGVGPFGSESARRMASAGLKYQDIVYVRDDTSAALARLATRAEVHVAPDLSLAEYGAESFARNRSSGMKRVIIVVRHYRYGGHGDAYLDQALRLAERLQTTGHDVEWISFQPEYDAPVTATLQEAGASIWEWEPAHTSFGEVYAKISSACCVVTARMHGIYLAGMAGTPVVGIGLHPKLQYAAALFPGYAAIVSASPSVDELLGACASVTSAPADVPHATLAGLRKDVDDMFDSVMQWATRE